MFVLYIRYWVCVSYTRNCAETCDNHLPFLQEITGCGKVNVDDDIQEWMEKGEQQKHQHFRHFQ